MSILQSILDAIRPSIREQMSVHETENTITSSARYWDGLFRDRLDYDRQKVLDEALRAWRQNPIARRIIELTTQFVIGDGISAKSTDAATQSRLDAWWNRPLNNLPQQLPEWADELWRTGDLFILCTVDDAGVLYARPIPAEMITHIETAPNDVRQELAYHTSNPSQPPYPAYDSNNPSNYFVLHYALNRAAGATFGESDLSPVLYWIKLYKQWLEDRARLNYFGSMFSYILRKRFTAPGEREATEARLRANQPKPGSILITDDSETWGTLTPNLGAFDANQDGLAIKRMIAVGAGMPMHYLAEPESSTRTTAEAAGTPTHKRLEARQLVFVQALHNLASIAMRASGIANAKIEIMAPDISERDNAALSMAAGAISAAIIPAYNAGLIDEQEYMRLLYRMMGEVSPEKMDGSNNRKLTASGLGSAGQNTPKVDKATGEVTNVPA